MIGDSLITGFLKERFRSSCPRTLIFVRHGQARKNVLKQKKRDRLPQSILDTLTECGKRQAEITGAWLRSHFHFDVCYSSTHNRSRQTIEIMFPDFSHIQDCRLNEVSGKLETLSEQVRSDAKKRIESFLCEVLFRHHDHNVVISSHGKIIRWGKNILLGEEDEDPPIKRENGSVTIFRREWDVEKGCFLLSLKEEDNIVPWEGKL